MNAIGLEASDACKKDIETPWDWNDLALLEIGRAHFLYEK